MSYNCFCLLLQMGCTCLSKCKMSSRHLTQRTSGRLNQNNPNSREVIFNSYISNMTFKDPCWCCAYSRSDIWWTEWDKIICDRTWKSTKGQQQRKMPLPRPQVTIWHLVHNPTCTKHYVVWTRGKETRHDQIKSSWLWWE